MRFHERVSRLTGVLLLLLGSALLVLYRLGVKSNSPSDIRWFIKISLVQSAIYLLAAWIVFRARSSRSILILVIVFAALFRLSILFAPPYLSDDIYRYIWDGRVQEHGINPYRYIPAAPELAHLRDDTIYPRINRRNFAPTIYPPLAQLVFLVTTRISETVTWMKLTMVGFEAVAVWAMVQLLTSLGLPRQRVLAYAWHPLVVWEFAGSGHCDAIAIAFIALAFFAWHKHQKISAALALACATLIKIFPWVLLPAILKLGRWKTLLVFAAAVIVAYLAYLNVGPKAVFGYLPGYAKEQGLITGEQFYLLSLTRKLLGAELPGTAFIVFAVLVMGALACWALLRKDQNEDNLKPAMLLATTWTVLFAPHFSWYFTWLVLFLSFTPSAALFYLTCASFVLYATWLGDSRNAMLVMNSIIYLPALLICVIEFCRRHPRSRSLPVHELNLPAAETSDR